MNLAKIYEAYIACLNARELNRLDEYVGDSVIYNSSKIGLTGYRELLAGNYRDIPDLRFVIDLLLSDPSTVASRLRFDCRPKAEFLGLRVDGRHVVFHENVFYRFAEGRIQEVWSVIDRVEIEKQLKAT
jgi:predicted ester cyclase